MIKEFKRILGDSYVMIIFIAGCFLYPVIYGLVYSKGTVDDMPIAVVDNSCSAESRRYIQKIDATREVRIAAKCANMEEAEKLMQQRKVHGIIFFPEDYGRNLAEKQQATVSTYADMSSFLYYKDLTMAANHAMLDELRTIGAEETILGEEAIPYNPNFSFLIFFLSAAILLVIQQTMFYGISVINGGLREQGVIVTDSTLLGRASAYAVIYLGICCYTMFIVPAMFGLPRRGAVIDMAVLSLFFIAACLAFSFTFSRFVHRRETVFVVLLFISSICLFLSGCSWPTTSFPAVWKALSYVFPSTFAIQGFNNVNNAGCTLAMIRPQIIGLAAQTAVYSISAFVLNIIANKKAEAQAQTA